MGATNMARMILEHLTTIDPKDFIDLDDADVPQLLAGQASTADFLASLGSPNELLTEDQAHAARTAFAATTNPDVSEKDKRNAILALKVPQAVRHLAGMLSEYDWEYVEQAKQLRGYVVAQLLEETKNPDAKIRLRALELTGKLTEVGSFTERIQVTKVDATSDELTARIREKLAGLLPKVIEVQDVSAKPDA